MNRKAIFFLILLRLAIGWHFATEGVQKIHSFDVGVTTIRTPDGRNVEKKPFSSEGYFREAPGPAGPLVRTAVLDNPDEEMLALVTVEVPEGDSPSLPPHRSMPKELRRRWERLLANYSAHYKLSPEQQKQANGLLDQAGDGVVLWLTSHTSNETAPELTRKFPSGEVKRRVAPAELIADYKARLADLKQSSERKPWDFGKDVEKANLSQKKADVAERRKMLKAEVDRHEFALKRSLNILVAQPVADDFQFDLLELERRTTENLLKQARAEAETAPPWWCPAVEDDPPLKQAKAERIAALQAVVKALSAISATAKELDPLTPEEIGSTVVTPIDPAALGKTLREQTAQASEQAGRLKASSYGDEKLRALARDVEESAAALGKQAEKLPAPAALPVETKSNERMEWIDLLTGWGLTGVGLCLLVGLLSRTNAWLGAGFLLMTYLLHPPWPWLPSVGAVEGNPFLVNKNLIEMLACCVLGVTTSGRAFGFDAILHWAWTKMSGSSRE